MFQFFLIVSKTIIGEAIVNLKKGYYRGEKVQTPETLSQLLLVGTSNSMLKMQLRAPQARWVQYLPT